MPNILIAEDDPLVGSLLEKGLRSNGFSTVLVDDGEQAEELGVTSQFDLLILDIGLPLREGLEVLKNLREQGARLPVLVLTGRRDIDEATCLEAGADDYMKKPFRFDELLARVQARIAARAASEHPPAIS